jgi:excisionase family DNA binding protein
MPVDVVVTIAEAAAAQLDTTKIDLDWLRNSTAAAISRRQTAQVLDVDERTVTRAIECGELPSLQIGRRVLIPRVPLLRLLGVED